MRQQVKASTVGAVVEPTVPTFERWRGVPASAEELRQEAQALDQAEGQSVDYVDKGDKC